MKTYNIKNMMIFKIKILNKLKINKISKIIIIEINFKKMKNKAKISK